MKKKGLWGLLIGLCCALCAITALAAEPPEVWVLQAGEGEAAEALAGERIHWWFDESAGRYYLFLPAVADASALRIFSGAEGRIQVNGTPITRGTVTDALVPGEELTLHIGTRAYPLIVMQSANVPALFLHTENGTLDAIHADKSHKETGGMLLVDAQGGVVYDGALRQLKGRGNATFKYDKKPYQIKLEDKTDLLGMGKARTWVLLANYSDYSLLRNRLTFELAKAVGLAYTPEGRPVDLYVDGDYKGAYLLTEKIEIDQERVDIFDLEAATEAVNDQPLSDYARYGPRKNEEDTEKGFEIPNDPSDITGGYLLELDYPVRYDPEMSGFVTRRGQAVVIKEPEFASQAQVSYIRNLMQNLEDSLRTEDGRGPVTGMHYTEIVDMDSFVRKYLVEEVVKNYDGNKSSLYFYKPSDEVSPLLFVGPAWDYDSSLGNFAPEHNPKFSQATGLVIGTDTAKSSYMFPAAYSQPDFYQEAVQVYHEVFVPVLEVFLGEREAPAEGSLRAVDDYAAEIAASAEMNIARWPISIRTSHPVDTGSTFPENIDYLKAFISDRKAFLTETWSQEKEEDL